MIFKKNRSKWPRYTDLQCYSFYVAVASRLTVHNDGSPTLRFQIWISNRRAGTDAQVEAHTLHRSPRNYRMIPFIVLLYFFLRVIPLQSPSLLRFVGLSVGGANSRDCEVSPIYWHQCRNKRNTYSHSGTFMIKLHVSLLPIFWISEHCSICFNSASILCWFCVFFLLSVYDT